MSEPRLNLYTNSFINWKTQTQDTFEFSVLICNAVPTLKRNIKLYEKGVITSLATPDYYGSRKPLDKIEQDRYKDQLKEKSVGYKSKLSKYILISNFSFFESYVTNVLNELLDFHGGKEKFLENAKRRGGYHVVNGTDQLESLKRKIRRANKPEHKSKYQIASRTLDEFGYSFPSDLLSGYGVQMLISKIGNMKSNDIPALMTDGLHLNLSESEVLGFHNARNTRNKIAHGENQELTIQQVTQISMQLKSLVLKLDQHLLRHYFISQNYL